ncbi:glycosyltransferase family protein [Clostridium tagluense]|uniref:glycosyltransferase family protein n=1 Tax=Clostridium tagluense TaxID=360422 RepID=UPI001CF28393|nr:glycosyltransferase family protein [Clostridium tagluense]MCB2310030.1 glycosyltransferase family protein [Clostridium tagluense]MCB2314440.1 glycosyltransferase family protein [Clostridium tagluense]MCB2319286.1 glycosyltransferase family protein [Clostridium tagluense]MCB2324624.1 glycosyltransferase family protein [Clostridium tagluense]MCB2329475.1 glycosyltransferase family protein [Clostridium tagluense]
MKIDVIIQARMGSTRLPNKVLMKFEEKTILEHVINRLKLSGYINDIIIATTLNEEDEKIVKLAEKIHVNYFRGSEEDVLGRYYYAAKQFQSEIVVRITSDCPLVDYEILDKMLIIFIERYTESNIDFLSNTDVVESTFPRGFDIEIFTFKALEKTYFEANKQYQREHVTPYIYQNPDKFKLCGYANDVNYSNYRLTVDTIEDFNLIKFIYNKCYNENKYFNLNAVLELLKSHPEITDINKNIKQKQLQK